MKNRKSLIWGLVGLAVIILLGAYFYNEDQKRRMAEAEVIEEQKAAAENKQAATGDSTETPEKMSQETTAADTDATSDTKADDTAESKAADTTATDAAEATDTKVDDASNEVADSSTGQAGSPSSKAADAGNETTADEEPLSSDESASSSAASSAEEEASANSTADAGATGSDTEPSNSEPVPAPKFDLVRVEPDGSTIIAGKAKAGAVVEVVTGEEVLAQSEVGQSGDFAAVFEDPLEPGDYEIVLRVVEEGEVVSQSEEVATVSVPEENPKELLVIVTKPGEASRIITQPSAPEVASATGEQPVAMAENDKAAAEEVTATETTTPKQLATASGDEETVAATETPSPDTGAEIESETAANNADDMDASDTETKTVEADVKAKEIETTTADTSEAGSVKVSQDSVAPSDEKKAMAEETKTAALDDQQSSNADVEKTASAAGESDASDKKQDQAAIGDSADPTEESGKASEANLRIDAVEIEGGRVFVAGSATPEAMVRVYADGVAIGDSKVSSSGRFLVEAQHDISVGPHTISADLMLSGSDAATMRVAVPFVRPEGETVAAVAAPKASKIDESGDEAAAVVTEAETQPEKQTAVAKTEDVEQAPVAIERKTDTTGSETDTKPAEVASENNTASTDEEQPAKMVKADETAPAAGSQIAEAEPVENKTETAASDTQSSNDTPAQPTDEASTADQPATAQVTEKKTSDQQPAADAMSAKTTDGTGTSDPEQVQTTDNVEGDIRDGSAAASDVSESSETQLAAADAKPATPETVVQEPLETKEGSVIIRRGDTLWQISRRVYGRGVRYTTIYLANSDQITNPDFIEPGQIFMVPNQPLNNAEQLHRDRIKRR